MEKSVNCPLKGTDLEWHLAEVKRIVDPLDGLNGGDIQRGCVCCVELHKKINETLKRAGGE